MLKKNGGKNDAWKSSPTKLNFKPRDIFKTHWYGS